MSVRLNVPHTSGIFFITFTNYKWLPLFHISNGYDSVYHFFDNLKSKGHWVNAYVIMPNHVHCLITFNNSETSINNIVGNGKRFMAYEIIKQLKQQGQHELLKQLQQSLSASDRAKSKQHEVFEPSFDWKFCESEELIVQKLDYIHNNPVRYKTPLADRPENYFHSSASFYYLNEHSAYPVEHIGNILHPNTSFRK